MAMTGLTGGAVLRISWHPMQALFSPGIRLMKVRIRWISMKFSSSAWKKMFAPDGTVKAADPSS